MMSSPEVKAAAQPGVRSLRQDDARGVALLVADVFAEIGNIRAMSVEQTERLFATPWLEGGVGLVLQHGSELAGYGFARPTRWKGSDSIQLGVTLRRGFRELAAHHALTGQLLEAATDLARKHSIGKITSHLRGVDEVHPPILLELGFEEHPVSMLGFRHNLKNIPSRCLPEGLSARPARLPEENSTVLNLSSLAFDDRDRQGEPVNDNYIDLIAGKPGFNPEQVLIVENSGAAVGCGIADSSAQGPGVSHSILQLGVLAGSRRRGIGSALVCRFLARSKAEGASAVLTGMFSSNLASTLFWRLGFRPDPERTFRFFIRDAAATPPHFEAGLAEPND